MLVRIIRSHPEANLSHAQRSYNSSCAAVILCVWDIPDMIKILYHTRYVSVLQQSLSFSVGSVESPLTKLLAFRLTSILRH